MGSSSVPFHCIICFDEFSLVERPPVVLPCGHTYVCAPCSKRLTRCMECRVPLCWAPPPKPTNKFASLGLASPAPRRHSPPTVSPPSPPPSEKAPMPKNMVLLALMEASQRVSKQQDENEDTTNNDSNETNRVALGMEILSGNCGTYAVRDEVAVLPVHPLVRERKDTENNNEEREPFCVQLGQNLQVVSVNDGVVKLARDEGYVVAASQQLVKIGGPQDSCCQLEGMLDLVASRKRDAEKKLKELQELENSLKQEIKEERQLEPTHPIISVPSPDYPKVSSMDDDEDNTSISISTACSHDDVFRPKTPTRNTTVRTVTSSPRGGHDELLIHSNRLVCTTPSPQREPLIMEDPLAVPYTIDNSDVRNASMMDFACTSSLFGESIMDENTGGGIPVQEEMDRRLHPPSLSVSSFDSTASSTSIDFRTGMSGHRALLSFRKIGNASHSYRGEVRMMSEHNGIGRAGRRSRTMNKGFSM